MYVSNIKPKIKKNMRKKPGKPLLTEKDHKLLDKYLTRRSDWEIFLDFREINPDGVSVNEVLVALKRLRKEDEKKHGR